MFHPEELLNKEYIRKVWQAANDLPTGTVKEHDLPEICRNMDTLISNESNDLRKKLSLRTSATLINGAARLYRIAGDNILDDVISLHMNITQRKRNLSIDSSIDSSNSTKANATTQNCEPSSKRIKTRHTKFRSKTFPPSRHTANKKNRLQDTRSDECPANIVDRDALQQHFALRVTTTPVENGIARFTDRFVQPDVDKNLPFGCLMIYKDYNSRLPSCFVFSSLKHDLKQILKEQKML